MEDKVQDKLTYRIIGCAMKVHSKLGNGFQEVIYQRALKIEMEQQELSFQREIMRALYYNNQPIGKRRVDFLIEGEVLVEIKAVTKLNDIHLAQGLNYLKAYQIEKGLLLNFGSRSLEIKRLKNPAVIDVRN